MGENLPTNYKRYEEQCIPANDISKITVPVGATLKIKDASERGTRTIQGVVKDVFEHYINVEFSCLGGNYVRSINKVDIALGEVQVSVIS